MRIITTLTLSTVLVLNFIISFARRSVDPNSRAAQAPIAAPGSPQRLRQEIEAIEDLLPRLADRAAALYFLAGRYARLGEHARALALLKECVALDEGFTPSDAHGFASLKSNPEFRDLAESIRRRYPPVHHAHIALTLPQNDIFPEGLAVDVSTRHFFMSSEHQNKIVTFTEAGKISDFVKEGVYNLMPVGGVHIDPNDHSVWCATDPGEENRSELVHFDPQGKLLERYAAPGSGPHNLNDLGPSWGG